MTIATGPSLKTIVVLGATGQQGGSVLRALLTDGSWRLRTISRNPDAPAAQRLKDQGVEVIGASLDDPEALSHVFKDVHGVYSVQSTDAGTETETRRGIVVADVALAAGVSHFIYASVGGAERNTGVPHFESKWRIEEHVCGLGLPATIVRPTFFMDNFLKPSMRLVLLALMRSYLDRATPLQMIAVEDIGKWTARAFADPDAFIGRSEEIAGDELTRPQVTAALRRRGWSVGLPFGLPRLLLQPLPGDVLKMFEWFEREGYRANIPALRVRQSDLMSFEQWLSARTTADQAV